MDIGVQSSSLSYLNISHDTRIAVASGDGLVPLLQNVPEQGTS
jgi:hypothetical protein